MIGKTPLKSGRFVVRREQTRRQTSLTAGTGGSQGVGGATGR